MRNLWQVVHLHAFHCSRPGVGLAFLNRTLDANNVECYITAVAVSEMLSTLAGKTSVLKAKAGRLAHDYMQSVLGRQIKHIMVKGQTGLILNMHMHGHGDCVGGTVFSPPKTGSGG